MRTMQRSERQPGEAAVREHPRDGRGTPAIRVGNLGPGHATIYVKVEAFNPLGSVKDRLALGVIEAAEKRRAEARPDRDRGDQRQHRHRARHGVRAEGLSAGRDDGRELQRRAPQADALPRRQGRADAGGASAASAWWRRRSSSPRRMAGS